MLSLLVRGFVPIIRECFAAEGTLEGLDATVQPQVILQVAKLRKLLTAGPTFQCLQPEPLLLFLHDLSYPVAF